MESVNWSYRKIFDSWSRCLGRTKKWWAYNSFVTLFGTCLLSRGTFWTFCFCWLKRRRRLLEGCWPPSNPFRLPPHKKIRFSRVPPLVFQRFENVPRDNRQVPFFLGPENKKILWSRKHKHQSFPLLGFLLIPQSSFISAIIINSLASFIHLFL